MDDLMHSYNDPKAQARREKLRAIAKNGVRVPQGVYQDVNRESPTAATRAWPWWSVAWSYPTGRTWEWNESELPAAQASWDASERFVKESNARRAEREAGKREIEARRQAEADAVKQAETAALTEQLRRAYLAQPGSTPEGFEKALPGLLEQRIRDAALASIGAVQSPITARDILEGGI